MKYNEVQQTPQYPDSCAVVEPNENAERSLSHKPGV